MGCHPLPEAQLQQSEQPQGAESLSPPCHLHTPRQWHGTAAGLLQHSRAALKQPPLLCLLPWPWHSQSCSCWGRWAQPGQSARLFCTLSPQYNISHFGISWYQQRPGHSLQYLLYYNSERDKHKPAGTPERFSATKDLASNACILTIAAACQDDNGTYYCALSPALRWL
ncbi:pre-B lymphocyte protein 3 isoform X1 [Passer montanus]|uniref:pre-B lymphocyte protein 3 isoform X1 n=1 Tax=Passer montanus TaxID=9160 RepID=UPI001961FA15|nr:pre-B lymphocyte protein 3 isoform X1 [Passer montanus]